MLAINGEKVDLNNRENDFVRLVYEPTMKLLKTLDLKRYTFGEVEEKKTITREGIVEHSAGTNPQWNARCSFKTDKGQTVEYFVKYYETSFMDKDGNEQFFAGPNKTRWDFNGTPYQVNFETKSTLVWWLIFACPECEPVPLLKEWQNQNKAAKPQYRLLDSAKDASRIIEGKRAVAKAENLILNDETDGGLSEKDLRTMCMAMGIGGTNNMTGDECRNLLHSRIIVKDGKWDRHKLAIVHEFLNGVKENNAGGRISDEASFKALIHGLTEGENPILTHLQGKWVMGDTVICKHKFSIDAKEALTVYFKENPQAVKDFESKLIKV